MYTYTLMILEIAFIHCTESSGYDMVNFFIFNDISIYRFSLMMELR